MRPVPEPVVKLLATGCFIVLVILAIGPFVTGPVVDGAVLMPDGPAMCTKWGGMARGCVHVSTWHKYAIAVAFGGFVVCGLALSRRG